MPPDEEEEILETPTPEEDSAPEETPEPEEEPEGKPEEESKAPLTPEWAQKRIAKLVYEREEEKRKATEVKNELEKLKNAPKVGETPEPKELTESEIDRRAKIKADADRRAEKFNDACNKTYDVGKSKFKDFDVAIQNLNSVGALGQNVDPTFLETVTELDDAAMVIHHLGNNPDEAAKMVLLQPKKMAIELARLEASLKKPSREVSQAPAPITPVGGRAKAEIDPDGEDVPMEKWLEWRNKQLERRRSR